MKPGNSEYSFVLVEDNRQMTETGCFLQAQLPMVSSADPLKSHAGQIIQGPSNRNREL